MPMYHGTDKDDTIFGSAGNDEIHGMAGDDTIYGRGGEDHIEGGDGDDTVYYEGDAGMVHTGNGEDYIYARKTSGAQIHVYGENGDDTIVMDVASSSEWKNRDGHHVFGGRGNDRFIFENHTASEGMLIGRIDDFDNSRDTLWLGKTRLDLYDLPDQVRIVETLGQQWLLISNEIAYALEGGRKISGDSEEIHFPDDQFSLGLLRSLPSVAYIDQVNFVPHQLYEAVEDEMRKVDGSARLVAGSARADHISDGVANAGTILGEDGDDVLDANGGEDIVYGGNGDDMIAGGQDDDRLHGDAGADILFGGSEDDVLQGDGDDDSLHGGTGDDGLYGGTGDDELYGDEGQDALYGGLGDDSLYGGTGGDEIQGEEGDDRLDGNAGEDVLRGGAGDDVLFGQGGRDVLRGEGGDDRIAGGEDQDIVWGGDGDDVFRIKTDDLIVWGDLSGSSQERILLLDRIEDFVVGEDRIDLTDLDGVSSRSDVSLERTEIGQDSYVMLSVDASDERLLIGVEEGVSLREIEDAGNFLF